MNLKVSNTLRRSGWLPLHFWGSLILAMIGFAVTWEAWADMLNIGYGDEEASHMFLVPFVVVWMFWVRKERFRQCKPVGLWIGPVVVAVGWLIGFFGYYNKIQSFWHGGAVVVVVGCFLTLFGLRVLKAFLPAFVVLIFLVPVPGSIRQAIAIPLQLKLAQISAVVFQIIGIEVERTGNVLTVNNQPIEIAEACNGMRMVFALILVSFAYAFGTPLKNYVRVIIMFASPLLAIACNVIRLIPTIFVYAYAPKWGDPFHEYVGWAMYFVAFFLLMSIIKILQWAYIPVTQYKLAYD